MDSTQAIVDFVTAVQKHALPFLVAITAIGTLGMALLETLKKVAPIRNRFQKRFLKSWLTKCAAAAPTLGDYPNPPDPVVAEAQLVRLGTADDRKAFYDLPTEKLCGQANAAAQAMLDSPAGNADLLRCLAATALPADLNLVFQAAAPATGAPTVQDIAQARARVVNQIQRGLDSIQISCGSRWERLNQLSAFILCFLLTEFALLWFGKRHSIGIDVFSDYTIKILIVSLVGGVLAPVAKDLKTAVEQLKAK